MEASYSGSALFCSAMQPLPLNFKNSAKSATGGRFECADASIGRDHKSPFSL